MNSIILTPTEEKIVGLVGRHGKNIVSLQEVSDVVGVKSPGWHLENLNRKGLAKKVSRGTYALELENYFDGDWLPSPYTYINALLGDRPYYVGGVVALYFSGLTTQVYWSRIDVFSEKHLNNRIAGYAKVIFHKAQEHKLKLGTRVIDLEDEKVMFSDPEKTVLDILELPKLFGKADGGVGLVTTLFEEINVEKLTRYATIIGKASSCQKLGVLLDRQQLIPKSYESLLEKVRAGKGVPVMDASNNRKGKLNAKWRIIENDVIRERKNPKWQ